MRKHFICGQLFTGLEETAESDQTIVIDDDRVTYVGSSDTAPEQRPDDEVLDYSRDFVLPGLIDIHVHLSYGNAQSNEDIDMYSTPEFRSLRAMHAAQRVLAAGYTSIADPASTGYTSVAVRDAVNAGMFPGPRITTSGRQITSRQGLGDWYPSWIGAPESSIGVLVHSTAEAIEEVRLQVKNRVDFIKFTADGLNRNPAGELMACFNQPEVDAIVEESHRLGRKVISHARGREAVLQSAKAGVDIIFHAFEMDDEGLDAVLESGSVLSPALTFLVNTTEFTRPSDPCHRWRPGMNRRDIDVACESLIKAREAGVPFMVGTDSGFAITPYGEWHARELEIMVEHLGFTPGEALRCTTSVNAQLLRENEEVGRLAPGSFADITVVGASPLEDITALQKRENIKDVYLGGRKIDCTPSEDAQTYQWEQSYRQWNDVYTRDRVAELAE
ncbi:MAG: amidohydrolase family protein [Pseudomonadota bacterium]|jgi:imidazolonepropionase-like amidohydrolase|nr:amidohydrolase family protein [Pseudomonadota bacterium]